MKKTNTPKILAGGALSLSLLLTALPSFAGSSSSGSSGLSVASNAQTAGTSSGSSSISISSMQIAQSYGGSADPAFTDPGEGKPALSDGKPEIGAGSAEMQSVVTIAAASPSDVNAETSTVEGEIPSFEEVPGTVAVEEGYQDGSAESASYYNPFKNLAYDCLKGNEAQDILDLCSTTEGCLAEVTPRDLLGNSYFLMKVAIGASQCTTNNGGRVSSVLGDPSDEDPKVNCAYVKALCAE